MLADSIRVELDMALIENNVRVGGEIALEYARLVREDRDIHKV